MIVEFKVKAKSFWKSYKNIFCPTFKPQTPEEKIKWKSKKDEYIGFLTFIPLIYFFDLCEFIFGSLQILELISFTIINAILLYCVKRDKLEFLKIIFCIVSSTVGFFGSTNDFAYILGVIVYLAVLPSVSLMLTRCIIKSMIIYCINLIEALIIFRPLIDKILAFFPGDLRSKIVIPFISISFSLGLLIMIVCWILLDSRKRMLIKLIKEKTEVEGLNKILINKNKELQEFADKRYCLLLSVSHEVRNPLNIISGTTDLALMDNPSQSMLIYLETIKISSELMTYLINNLLDYSKIDKYELTLCPSPISTNKLMENLWNISKNLIKKRNLFGKMFVSKNMPKKINIDEKRLMQIVYNLVGNASKFTNDGYISIICTWINKNNATQDMTEPTNEDAFRSHLNEKSSIQKPKLSGDKLELSKYLTDDSKDLNDSIGDSISLNSDSDDKLPTMFKDYFIQRVPKTLHYKILFDNYKMLRNRNY